MNKKKGKEKSGRKYYAVGTKYQSARRLFSFMFVWKGERGESGLYAHKNKHMKAKVVMHILHLAVRDLFHTLIAWW